MIINFFVDFVFQIFGWIFSILPFVSISNIPYIGSFVYTKLQLAMGYWNTAREIIPYFQVVWDMFLYVILPFELLLLVARFFLGHRLPAHLN